jgi:hypothetical protein
MTGLFFCNECRRQLVKVFEDPATSSVFRMLCPHCDRDLITADKFTQPADGRLVEDTIEGRRALVAYMKDGQLVPPSEATQAIARFDDGSESVFQLDPSKKGDPR